jgi:ornithine carbamoyltransferase
VQEKKQKGLQHKDLLSIHDLTSEEVERILTMAQKLKRMQKIGVPHEYCKGKTLAMLFSKASTRTRISFETGFHQLGGHAIYLSDKDSQIGRGEPIRDTARVLSRMVDGIMVRTFAHASAVELAAYASIPVINGLTDLLHPCQALTDLLTIREHRKTFKGRKLVYVGDGNNMAHSLMYACAKVGMNMVCASPRGYQPDPVVVKQAQEDAALTGCTVTVEENIFKAAENADVLYADVWTSMGEEAERDVRMAALHEYQINSELLKVAREDALVMHCLPAHRGEEITEEVLEGPQSVVWDEAENRLHTQKAIMALLMSDVEL